MASANGATCRQAACPSTCTIARHSATRNPKTIDAPTRPSGPTAATPTEPPSRVVEHSDTTPESGNRTY
jgi:hypothetical protein